jgi:hypothetical protein
VGPAQATCPTGVDQCSTNNYVGPGPCPFSGDGADCKIVDASVPITIVQTAPTGGNNQADCNAGTCGVTQRGTNEIDKPTNSASCTNTDTTTGNSSQLQTCNVSQLGGTNTIAANFTANSSTGNLNLTSVTETSKQKFVTSQNGDTNNLTVNGKIVQSATSQFDAGQPVTVTHTQRTLQLGDNTMIANVANFANYNLDRNQASTATAAHPTQLQDDIAGTPSEKLGVAHIKLTAPSAGTNQIKIRGIDTKNQTATSVDLAAPTQTQGHPATNTTPDGYDGSGINLELHVDSGVQNANGPDIDVGTAGASDTLSNNGLFKKWTQNATGPGGIAIASNQTQSDGLPIHILSSPFYTTSNSSSILKANAGAHIFCREAASGNNQVNWTGRLFCDDTAGTNHASVALPFSAKFPNVSIACDRNTDVCDGTTTNDPHSVAFMAVRNVTTNQQFTAGAYNAPNQTAASPSDTVELRASYSNEGDSASSANNATLTTAVPANTTFVSCSDACSHVGSTVSWSLGNVPGGTVASRLLDVQVRPAAPAGAVTDKATPADDNETNLQDSNVVTINVVNPVTCVPNGCFTIGANYNPASVEWWGSDWSTKNPLTPNAPAPSSFKGYENTIPNPACGTATWNTTGGTSPPPAGGVPNLMRVIVTSKVGKAGSGISGNIVHIVIVKTNPGYSPNSGGIGTGTVVDTVC